MQSWEFYLTRTARRARAAGPDGGPRYHGAMAGRTDSSTRSDPTGVVVMIVAASLFGTLGVLSRTAYDQGLAPFAFVAWRGLIGGLGLWAAVLLRGRRGSMLPWGRMSSGTRRSLGLAILLGAGLNLFMFFAFSRTTIALALLAFYTYPAIVAAVSVALGRERLDPARGLALLLSLAGMAAVVLGGLGTGTALQVDPLGIAAALGAAGCQAAFVLINRSYATVPSDQAMASILTGAGLVASVVTIVSGGPALLLKIGRAHV